jgi:hypothetical protein
MLGFGGMVFHFTTPLYDPFVKFGCASSVIRYAFVVSARTIASPVIDYGELREPLIAGTGDR